MTAYLLMKQRTTALILEYCRLKDGPNKQKEHSSWCELETGLWHYCDCGFDKQFELLQTILFFKRECKEQK